MLNAEYLFYLILFNLVLITPQLNLYHTDLLSTIEKDIALQYNCFYAPLSLYNRELTIQVNTYCMNEFSSKFVIETIDYNRKLQFDELANENITSHQLYLWSAPIDIIEDYQFYLNQLSIGNTSSLSNKTFYNCTWPRFGSLCQYEFYASPQDPLPVHDIIENFYRTFPYNPINLTCYEHLDCHYRTFRACLDWTEICNGDIDCMNDGIDEKHCWQLEINQCTDDEYRCFNGQCITQSFYNEDSQSPECFDRSDHPRTLRSSGLNCRRSQPSFYCEDIIHNYDFGMYMSTHSRRSILLEKLSWNNTNSTSSECWLASKCLLRDPNAIEDICQDFCAYNACIHIVARSCPDILELTDSRFSFGHLSLYYKKIIDQNLTTTNLWHLYICYSLSYFNEFFQIFVKIQLNNRTCFFYETIAWSIMYGNIYSVNHTYLMDLHRIFRKYNLLPNNFNLTICQQSNMYQCMNSSKCISIYRLFDLIDDCPYMDDEDLNIINKSHVIKQLNKTHIKCQLINKYIPKFLISDTECQCDYNEYKQCEDEKSYDHMKSFDSLESLSFQTICDGFIELKPNEQNHTDETECEQWSCDNIYTHCDSVWNCLNGADEINCNSSAVSICSRDHYQCVSQYTKQLICLPLKQINDKQIDCLGATDEILFCRKSYASAQSQTFYCNENNITTCIYPKFVCNHQNNCLNGNDEDFCEHNRTISTNLGICEERNTLLRSHTEKVLCDTIKTYSKSPIIYFKLDKIKNSTNTNERENNNNNRISSLSIQYQSLCQRGLHLLVWLNKTLTTYTCLCPPSYYGSHCQYQNQRVSLTIRFRVPANSYRTVFIIVILLIENTHERIIHSYEQITYVSFIHCKTKFNIYLQYSTRNKDLNKQYIIQIDFYDKTSLNYRGSVLLPVTLIFLPIQRLAVSVDIPSTLPTKSNSIEYPCVHGELIYYSNNPAIPVFCRCHSGWSGQYCTINFTCNCASNLQCIGMTASNRSICICPINTFGSRCILTNEICQNKSLCENDGQCIASNEYFSSQQSFICLCRNGFRGDRCEIIETTLILSFDTSLTLLQSVFIHFIQVFDEQIPERSTTFRTISFQQNSLAIHWSQPFHLVFIELENKNYYLTIKQYTYNQSTQINRTISLSDRCPHIRELFNASFMKWNLIRRIKYYHLPCQNRLLNLSCFYDEAHLCLCYDFHQQRLANCLNFTHDMKFDCSGQSVCENDGQCFQDAPDCPTRSICICKSCFYGVQCQFTTSGFSLTLDAILGYYIQPNIVLEHQPLIVKISLILTIIFIVFALINGIFSLMTFKNRTVREIGCGLYLLSSSITTLFILILFTLKFFILLYAQMARLTNRTFLLLQCQSIDFLLHISIYMDQWLNACVATERAYTIIKSIRFSKKRSKQIAKTVIILLIIVITASCIHDPIHRRLLDEENEDMKRIWCIVKYDSSLHLYDSIVNGVHFIGPFIMNLISTILLIIEKAHHQKNLYKHRSYRRILRSQIQENKHLFTAPIVLIILALPRLVIVFISKCLKSSNDVWIYLIGYFISFIPHTLTFVVFVIPSNFYKREFWKTVAQLKIKLKRDL